MSTSFRDRFRAGIEQPVGRFFSALHLTPNALTIIGFGIAIVGAWLAATQAWLPAALVVGFGALFDLFDGALARATGTSSRFGAFLDSTLDRAGEAVVYLGLVAAGMNPGLEPLAIGAAFAMAASFMVSYTRARAESLGFSSGRGMASVGLAPREVRSIILVVALFVAGLGVTNSITALLLGLGLIAVLAAVTTIQRILFTHTQSRSQEQEVNS